MLYTKLSLAITSNLIPESRSAANNGFRLLSCFVQVKRSLSTAVREMARPLPKNPLVWVDCEMTGLDLSKDKILEIAVRSHYPTLVRDPY